LTRRYEDLRQKVIAGTAGRRIDLSVMVRQGMWAWMELVDGEVPPLPRKGENHFFPSPMATPRPVANWPELESVWTDLLLGNLAAQEAR
jgi:hypothetical protein